MARLWQQEQKGRQRCEREKSRSIPGQKNYYYYFLKQEQKGNVRAEYVGLISFSFACLLSIQDKFKFSGLLLVVVTSSSPAQMPSAGSGEQGGGRQAGRLPLHLSRNEGLWGEYRCVHTINLSRAVPERFTAQDLDQREENNSIWHSVAIKNLSTENAEYIRLSINYANQLSTLYKEQIT